jgi:hypothetical protein
MVIKHRDKFNFYFLDQVDYWRLFSTSLTNVMSLERTAVGLIIVIYKKMFHIKFLGMFIIYCNVPTVICGPEIGYTD